MQNIVLSDALVDGHVRTCCGVEPNATTALARDDAETRLAVQWVARRLFDTDA